MALELTTGEEITWRAHPTWRGIAYFYLKRLFVIVLILVLLGFMDSKDFLVQTGHVVLIGFILIVAVGLWGWIRRLITNYTITNKRVVLETGIIIRRRNECPLYRIQNTVVLVSIPERILHIGRVNIDTAADQPGPEIVFWGVDNPYSVVSYLTAHTGSHADVPPAV